VLQAIRKLFGPTQPSEATTELGPGQATAGPLVRLEGVTKTFVVDRVATPALRDVDLDVERGEFVAVNGPSGSGKSTLLSIVGLLDTPSAGTYRLNGFDVGSLSAKSRAQLRNREVGFIFQSFNLIGDLTVREGGGRRAEAAPRRRADREPQFQPGRGRDRDARGASSRRLHDPPREPRPALARRRAACGRALRRRDRGFVSGAASTPLCDAAPAPLE
jgi:predicted ABC-type transport system involved in lysophospholipase L1 biosynthesis ATPase subunit